MTNALPSLDRRGFLCAALLAAASPRPAAARPPAAAAFPDGAGLLVAGPAGGGTDRWAELLLPALARALPPGNRLRREAVGGADGVTGANRFETTTAPDGGTALLAPGAAAMAWLAGDPRARFDAAGWVPALAGTAPGVIVSRLPAAKLGPGGTVRFATTGPAGPDLPALLALDLLGVAVQPVPVPASSPEVLSQPGVEAVFLHGPGAEEAARTLAALGTPTLLGLGLPEEAGRPSLPPGVPELFARGGGGPLHAAWRATAVAAQIDAALVLPAMAPAATVALWRRACAQAASSLQDAAAGMGVRLLPAPACASLTAALAVDAAGLLELRRWLVGWHSWRTG